MHVGGREVPWPTAPTYYGAAGLGARGPARPEYEGREIWGRETPQRDEPIEVPLDAVPSVPAAAMLPPGVSTPLPPGVTAPLIDEDALPPGVSLPPPPSEEPVDEAESPNGSANGAALFEELDNPAPAALLRAAADDDEITADHPSVDPDATEAYDPFAATDDELPPWETDEPTKRD